MIWFPFPAVIGREWSFANSSTRRRETEPRNALTVRTESTARTVRSGIRTTNKWAGCTIIPRGPPASGIECVVNVARHCYIVHGGRPAARTQGAGMATKVQWVSDEVWATLDPKAGAIR